MTEQSYQAGRELMQKLNGLRSAIAKAKGEVSKWSRIEDVHTTEMRPGQAEGANKMLKSAIMKLDNLRLKFDAIEFPASNLKTIYSPNKCKNFDTHISKESVYCNDCIHEQL